MATDGGLTPRAIVTTKLFERDLKRSHAWTPNGRMLPAR